MPHPGPGSQRKQGQYDLHTLTKGLPGLVSSFPPRIRRNKVTEADDLSPISAPLPVYAALSLHKKENGVQE